MMIEITESELLEADQFAAGCDLAPNAAIRIKKLAAACRPLLRMATNIQKLVDYACTVQRNSVLGGEPYVVVDVDGIVICTGPSVDAAMHWAVYKIETGEDVPDIPPGYYLVDDPDYGERLVKKKDATND